MKNKILILLVSLFSIFIISDRVEAWSSSQVPDFLLGFQNWEMVCSRGDTFDNENANENCSFSNADSPYLFINYLEFDTKLRFYPYVLLLDIGSREQDVRLYFSMTPLSLKCEKGSGNVDSCYLGTYKNGVFSNTNYIQLSGQAGLKNGSTVYFFNTYENITTNQIVAYENNGEYRLNYGSGNYANILDVIYANYDVYYVNDNTTHSSYYSYLDLSEYIDISIPDNRNIFEKIRDGILSIPNTIITWGSRIFNAIGDLSGNIVNGILNGLTSFFNIGVDAVSSKIVSLYNALYEELGFLTYPFEWIIQILNRYLTIEDTGSYVISWPDFTVPNFGTVIIHSGSFDLASILVDNNINTMHNYYLIIVDAVCILAFFNLCLNEYNILFGGYVSTYEDLTETTSYSYDSNGELLGSHNSYTKRSGKRESGKK